MKPWGALQAMSDRHSPFAENNDEMCRQTMGGATVAASEYGGWCCLLKRGHSDLHWFSNPAWLPHNRPAAHSEKP